MAPIPTVTELVVTHGVTKILNGISCVIAGFGMAFGILLSYSPDATMAKSGVKLSAACCTIFLWNIAIIFWALGIEARYVQFRLESRADARNKLNANGEPNNLDSIDSDDDDYGQFGLVQENRVQRRRRGRPSVQYSPSTTPPPNDVNKQQ